MKRENSSRKIPFGLFTHPTDLTHFIRVIRGGKNPLPSVLEVKIVLRKS
jgi:hypothetical protein